MPPKKNIRATKADHEKTRERTRARKGSGEYNEVLEEVKRLRVRAAARRKSRSQSPASPRRSTKKKSSSSSKGKKTKKKATSKSPSGERKSPTRGGRPKSASQRRRSTSAGSKRKTSTKPKAKKKKKSVSKGRGRSSSRGKDEKEPIYISQSGGVEQLRFWESKGEEEESSTEEEEEGSESESEEKKKGSRRRRTQKMHHPNKYLPEFLEKLMGIKRSQELGYVFDDEPSARTGIIIIPDGATGAGSSALKRAPRACVLTLQAFLDRVWDCHGINLYRGAIRSGLDVTDDSR